MVTNHWDNSIIKTKVVETYYIMGKPQPNQSYKIYERQRKGKGSMDRLTYSID